MTSVQPHIGHMLLENFKNNPDHVCQIDAATGESETNASVLRRVIRLSKYFRQLDLKPGDVITLCGRHHIDLCIPYYATLISGLTVSNIDSFLKYDEIKRMLVILTPKIVFCQQESYEDFLKALKELELDTRLVTFGGEDCVMKKLLDSIDGESENEFQAENDFDREKTFAMLIPTSGTTGVLKLASFTYNVITRIPTDVIELFPRLAILTEPGNHFLHLSPPHWIGSYINLILLPIFLTIKLQTSAVSTGQHITDIIKKYRPVGALMLPSTVAMIVNHPGPCDLTCFESIVITGSKFSAEAMKDLRHRMGPKAVVMDSYGQTEALGPILQTASDGPVGNCGIAMPSKAVKLIDPETEEEITEPNKPGEIWVHINNTFSGYYKMPEETAKALTPDGWLKTGDLLYRDENNYYFFLDRIKMLMKYKGYHILPTELEQVISTLEGVQEVAVTSIPDQYGELPLACVVRKPGADVTADDVKHIVASTLSDSKRLRGGVVFMDTLPMTSTGKVARAKLKELVKTARRE